MTARVVLVLLGRQLSEVALMKFLKGLEEVEVGFVKKEYMLVAVAKGV